MRRAIVLNFPYIAYPPRARSKPIVRRILILGVFCAALCIPVGARADPANTEATYQDIEQTLGNVPSFLRRFPKAALPGAWAEVKALQFSDETALPPKAKALISLAVSAQIPCQYCIWEDTESAKRAGATEDEINEAIAISALTRHWSTVFNGMQLDLEAFKTELGGDPQAQQPAN
ncbi:carboxymuconolactone decarboxylase family protein [Aurantimonas endophytica]|nr:carboxymuconolactone decarboxylase family protein [Aurantimonas endophytica]